MYAYPAGPPGDDDTFADICERYRPRLVAFCRRRLRGAHDAEDAAHEVLLRAYRAMGGFDASADAWPWLRTIAVRVCLDIRRRETRAPLPTVDGHHVEDVHDQFARRLRADIVEDALKQLPARHRTTLLLKEYAGWSCDDIARTHGTSRASVRSLLTRSRRRLGTQVEAVARDRGQWPLPGVVPPVQRLRGYVRSWRDSLQRSGHAVGAAFELSPLAGRWMIGAQATLAGMLSLSTATASTTATLPAAPGVVTSFTHTTTTPLRDKGSASVEVESAPITATAAIAVAPMDRETYTSVDTTMPSTDTVDANGTTSVTGNDEHIWVGWSGSTTVPGYDSQGWTGVNVSCTATAAEQLFCTAARQVLPYLPDQ